MATKSILETNQQVQQAIDLIRLGARMQVLESETSLPYERLLKLYKEVTGRSPSKGQLPFSTDWFLEWRHNVHSSLFVNIHENLNKTSALEEIDAIKKAYEMYLEQVHLLEIEPDLSFTRAWRLVKFMDSGMLTTTKCTSCKGHFVSDLYENTKYYVCGMCNPPARAGKGRKDAGVFSSLIEEDIAAEAA